MGRSIRAFSRPLALLAILAASAARAETPVVVFDLPLTIECRDVTPQRYEQNYKRRIVEAVVKISPQLLAGEEKGLTKLRYEISTEQQMPVVSFAPNSQLATDVAGGTMAIQTSDYHGQLLVHYLITPTAGDGKLTGDLTSSRAQYTLLAPKQILLAAGTIERGCGVYYDLRPSTQDTLQKQREFACLFQVPAAWRANYITVKCGAVGIKRGLVGVSEVNCGVGFLSVGLYKQGDGEAMEAAQQLAKRQQQYLDRLKDEAKARYARNENAAWLAHFFSNMKSDIGVPRLNSTTVGAALLAESMENKDIQASLPSDARTAGDELAAAQEALRKLNGSP